MMTVLVCTFGQHNIWLLGSAVIICVVSCWGVVSLFNRARARADMQRAVWLFLAAFVAGSAIWSTHFIALLSFEAGAPVTFDPALTVVSLMVAMVGAAAGFWIATLEDARFAPAVGGAVVGLAIVAMHYTGMIAYRIQGVISWNWPYVYLSIALCVAISAYNLHSLVHVKSSRSPILPTSLLVGAIIGLHFIGMAAFRVEPLLIDPANYNAAALRSLGFAVTGVAFLVGCAGLASYLIDEGVRADSIRELQKMAMNDGLTGLANRRGFQQRLVDEMLHADATRGRLALICIDLDRFKEINDTRGHAAGDEVLRALASRMAAIVSDAEFVARLGGDEFGAMHRLDSETGLADFIARLEPLLHIPVEYEGYAIAPAASIGIAIYPDNASDIATLVNNADLAMYRAKADVSRSVCYYQASMDETVRQRRALANELRHAIERNELSLHYQLQVNVASRDITGYEALLRWHHPERGNIPPLEFIGVAEENGLIMQVGEWVLRKACFTAANWDPAYKVSVNLSAIQLSNPELPQVVADILRESGLPAYRLELELTETAIFADRDRSLAVLIGIKALGVRIALDDFGTGYSSLDTLRSFPFDRIKLDRSFVRELGSSPQATAIVRAVLALGRSLDIPVIAEGIETEDQLLMLRNEGCDEAQGYLLGRPRPLSDIVASGEVRLIVPDRVRIILAPPGAQAAAPAGAFQFAAAGA